MSTANYRTARPTPDGRTVSPLAGERDRVPAPSRDVPLWSLLPTPASLVAARGVPGRRPRPVGSVVDALPSTATVRWGTVGQPPGPGSVPLALPIPLEGVGVAVLAVLALLIGSWFVRGYLRPPSVEVVHNEPDLMFSDRDRILLLIERHGGRIRQQRIVEQVEWSKAKVSRLLSDLEEEGIVRKVRLGRENLVCLESRDPVRED